ncbi:glucosyltransferase [Mactra antiquata]
MIIFVICCFFCFLSALVFKYISKAQNDPYMDEIFHVPQAQHYCISNFSRWDPMITTPPGLYLTSVGILNPVSAILKIPTSELCSTVWLRGTNFLFSVGNVYLVFALLRRLKNPMLDPESVKLVLTTIALSIFPVLYFFTFLYYTDPGSVFFVLIMYLYCLHDSHFLAAIFGVMSLFFRQTNIIWVVFMAGSVARMELAQWMKQICDKKDIEIGSFDDLDLLKVTVKMIFECLLSGSKRMIVALFMRILKKVWMYVLVGIGFIVFVYVNKGIVLGDRTQHEACLHLPQLFYFLTMVNFFAFSHLCTPHKIWNFLKFCVKHPIFVICFIALAYLMVNYFTYEHKYLLADNRHYTFYIWRKLYRRHEYVKFAFIPIYLYGCWSFFSELDHRDIFWKLVFTICVVISLVPQKLLEYRYFIIPYLLFRINMRYGSAMALVHEIALYFIVNAVTIGLFVERPFKWPDQENWQRFIW